MAIDRSGEIATNLAETLQLLYNIPAKRRNELEMIQTESVLFEVKYLTLNGRYFVVIDHPLNQMKLYHRKSLKVWTRAQPCLITICCLEI